MEATEIKAALDRTHAELVAFVKKAEGEIADAGKASAETKAAIEKMAAEAKDFADRLFKLEKKDQRLQFGDDGPSIGEQFVKSDAWKAMQTAGAGRARLQTKYIINATGQNQPLVPAQRLPGIIAEPNRRLTIRDLLPVGRTTSNLIEYAKENVFTNSAGPQGGTASPVQYENETKPESQISFTLATAAVTTLAHFIRASKQVLSDAPMLESYINQRLSYGLKLEEEDQILNGNGSAGNLSGLLTNATAYNRGATADTAIDTLRKAITQVQVSEYSATGIVLNPQDWESIELTKDSQLRYIFAQPQSVASPMMWGLPVVATNSIARGTFLVGAFAQCAQIWDREDASVTVSTEDGDNFVKNMVTILAEERIALAIYRTAGLVTGSL